MSSITHIVDDEKVLNEYEYDAWGEVVSEKETVKNRFKFNGQQLDPITQQYYLRARFYNPVIARFTQEDTYRGDGLNLYAYCRNNPVYYVDPTGHKVCPDGAESIRQKVNNNTATPDEIRELADYDSDVDVNQPETPKAKDVSNNLSYENYNSITAGKNFKDHYLNHRHLMEKLLGKHYPKWKSDGGNEFLGDIETLIYRGEGITVVLRENGEFWTLLNSGEGMDLGIQMIGE